MRKRKCLSSSTYVLDGSMQGFKDAKPFISASLVPLHQSLVEFFEATNIATNHEQLILILGEIKNHLDNIEAKCSYLTSTDKYYLQKLRQNFVGMLVEGANEANIKEIVNWCLEQNLLQQAVTMTTERLPRYMLHKAVIKFVEDAVVQECDKQRQPWDNWTGNFFKNYNPYSDIKKDDDDAENIELSGKVLKKIVNTNQYDYLKIMKDTKGKSSKFEAFMKSLVQLAISRPGLRFPLAVYSLNINNPIRVIARSQFKNLTADEFLEALKRNFRNTTPTEFILKMLATTKSDTLKELFDLQDDKVRKAKNDDDIEAKIQLRLKVFERLINENKLVVTDIKQFLSITESYLRIIELYRNRMNHGVIEFKGIEGNEKIKQMVMDIFKAVDDIALEKEP